MPGGSREAWKAPRADLERDRGQGGCRRPASRTRRARRPASRSRAACRAPPTSAPNGAGHYVKMVHNGIEYGDMQLICEAYDLMRSAARHEAAGDAPRSSRGWNGGDLDSFLIEITADILRADRPGDRQAVRRHRARHRRPEGHRQVDQRQRARPGRARADHRRGGLRPLHQRDQGGARRRLRDPQAAAGDRTSTATRRPSSRRSRDALYCSKICSYAQGFELMREAQKEYDWKLNFGEIARIWRGGCIIRAALPAEDHRGLPSATGSWPTCCSTRTSASTVRERAQANWREVVAAAVRARACRCPRFGSALAYYDGYRTRAPAGQPAAGPARLLRRPHLRAGRQAARRVLPRRLAGPGAAAVRGGEVTGYWEENDEAAGTSERSTILHPLSSILKHERNIPRRLGRAAQ